MEIEQIRIRMGEMAAEIERLHEQLVQTSADRNLLQGALDDLDAAQQSPAVAVPEGYEIKIDEDGLVQILDHVSKTSELIRQPIAIRYFTDLLSASPKP